MTLKSNPYIPKPVQIESVRYETLNVRTYTLHPLEPLKFTPGQFIEVLVPGLGEIPVSIASTPLATDRIEITVQRRGIVTTGLFSMSVGGILGVRGPYGRGVPLDRVKGKSIVVVATGIGIAAWRSLILYILERRSEFGEVTVIYGARYPEDLIYRYEYDYWSTKLNLIVTLSRPPDTWKGYRGRVTQYISRVRVDSDTLFFVCGSPVVISSVARELIGRGVNPNNIYISLERHMKCGMGLCARCMVKPGYLVCRDGPVFTLSEVREEVLGEE